MHRIPVNPHRTLSPAPEMVRSSESVTHPLSLRRFDVTRSTSLGATPPIAPNPIMQHDSEAPLVHSRQTNRQQISLLTQLLNRSSDRTHVQPSAQISPPHRETEGSWANTVSQNVVLNSFPQTHDSTMFDMSLSTSSSSIETMSNTDSHSDTQTIISPSALSSVIPIRQTAPQINRMIVGTPPFAIRREPRSFHQRSSLNSDIGSGNNGQGATSTTSAGQFQQSQSSHLSAFSFAREE
jgi:hypothetical protein